MPINGNVSAVAAALAALASGCGIAGVLELIKFGRELATRSDLLQQKEEMKTEISGMKKEIDGVKSELKGMKEDYATLATKTDIETLLQKYIKP